MRYLTFIFVVVSSWACHSAEDPLPIGEGTVLGSWELKEVSFVGAGNANVALSPFPIPVTFTGRGSDYDLTLIFEESEQSVTALGSFNLIVQAAAVGINVGEQTVPIIGSEAFRGTWLQNGEVLELAGRENTVNFQLDFRDEGVLAMRGNPNLRDFEIEGGGVTVTEADMEFFFERLP